MVIRKNHAVIIACMLVLTMFASLLAAKDIKAQTPEQRVEQWYTSAKVGLMIHWGMTTGQTNDDIAAYYNITDFEAAATAGGWNANKWVDEALRIKAKYITLCSFHSVMGYIKPWRSAIPGTMVTQRDYLGELVAAAHAKGIKVIVYITPDPKWHDRFGYEWMDNAGYRNYKNDQSIDMNTKKGWAQYSYDIVDELLTNYPNIDGLWFDGWNQYWDDLGLIEHIRSRNDNLVTIGNGRARDLQIADADSLENRASSYTPSYNIPSGFQAVPSRATAENFKIGGGWWYHGDENTFVDIPQTIRYIAVAAGSNFNVDIGEGPKIGGEMSVSLTNVNTQINAFLNWAGESIFGTAGGGFHKGGFQPGNWNLGSFGVTTLVPGGNTHYIHVLTSPTSGNQIVIPDVGYTVSKAVLLKTGQPLTFSQNGGYVTISVPAWDSIDTIIKLTATNPLNILPRASITATASSEDPSHPVASAVDDDYTTYYSAASGAALPQSITLKLNQKADISGLRIQQTEDRPVTTGQEGAPPPTRLKDYEVYVSNDGLNWGTPVKTGTLMNQRGVQQILFNTLQTQKRYVKFKVLNNYNNDGVLKIAQMDVFGMSGWNQTDLGTVTVPGSYKSNSDTNTVYGSGADVYGTSDNAHFVYKELSGDFSIQTRITNPSYSSNTAQFGIMARNSLDSNSKMINAYWTPANNYFKSLARLTTGASTGRAVESTNNALPVYAKITRSGHTFTTYKSTDGINFTQVRQETVAMNNTIYVGMYVCSHATTTALAYATFDNLTITQP
ncbi:alpha-L-fucosidase [Paenibacillus alba]|uniref:alpha-L-fucosidase n=1 Tax=Paenibacillus alba TaxID=1197127 RepID=UPI00156746C0|nr:alpha-L-fucosidase [Paenibacillus alba]NQX66498.1 alpha-L-fucosidase [Paenibacillus alba]